jgi:hypothetical protein
LIAGYVYRWLGSEATVPSKVEAAVRA